MIDDPAKLTKMILESVAACGVRAIISRGWSKLGASTHDPENVLFIDDCPHGIVLRASSSIDIETDHALEWLFQHVTAVIHHGGAGTTACGLLNGRPTTIVPFFGEYDNKIRTISYYADMK